MALALGKKPFVTDDRDFKLRTLMADGVLPLPDAPKRFGHGFMHRQDGWGMLGNDEVGDCVFAGFAHQAMISSKLGGHEVNFETSNVLEDYSAVTGYDPHNPDSDQGTVVRDGLNYWHHTGIVTAYGPRHQIGAFISIPAKDWDALMSCAFVFSSVGMGWEVPNTIWQQWDNNEPFDVVDQHAAIEGGHYTVVTGRTGMTIGGMITWGKRKSFTRGFYETYNDEAWAIVFPDELRKGHNERGFDLTQLNEIIQSLG